MIPYVDLAAQYASERDELGPCIEAVLASGHWIGGPDVAALERELQEYIKTPHVVAVGSGTDALILGLRALGVGPGDEVITPPNSFVSSTAAIVAVGATPVFVDVVDDQSIDPALVEGAITSRTRAIMPVHLTGRMADMPALCGIAQRYDVRVIEDAAQAFGSSLRGIPAGTYGDVGCFSAHPLKNLNASGDAGFIATSSAAVAKTLGMLRNNGLLDRDTVEFWGTVSRLDSVQAAILRHRLKSIEGVIAARRERARRYASALDPAHVRWNPVDESDRHDTFHTFVVQVDRRDELQTWLSNLGIGTSVHYPTPIHLQPAATALGYGPGDFPVAEHQAARILSLPIHPFLALDDVDRIVDAIHRFYRS